MPQISDMLKISIRTVRKVLIGCLPIFLNAYFTITGIFVEQNRFFKESLLTLVLISRIISTGFSLLIKNIKRKIPGMTAKHIASAISAIFFL